MKDYEACLNATSTPHAHWYVVPADGKENARLIISRIVLDALDALKKESAERTVRGAANIQQFIGLLRRPRAIMMLVPAGPGVDGFVRLSRCLSQRLAAGQSHPGPARLFRRATYEWIDAKCTFYTEWEKK